MDTAFFDNEIKQAMLAKNTTRLRGLRAIKAAILLAKTEKGGNDELPQDQLVKLLQKLVKQRTESAEIYTAQNRADLAAIEQEEIDVINSFLPAQLSEAEIADAVRSVIAESGATGIKDMGKVMGLANTRLAGRADGKTIAAQVKLQLGN